MEHQRRLAPVADLLVRWKEIVMALHHDKPPERTTELPEEILRKLTELQSSPYYAHVISLKPLVVGRNVLKAEAGTSGFTLYLVKHHSTFWSDHGKKLRGSGLTWARGMQKAA